MPTATFSVSMDKISEFMDNIGKIVDLSLCRVSLDSEKGTVSISIPEGLLLKDQKPNDLPSSVFEQMPVRIVERKHSIWSRYPWE